MAYGAAVEPKDREGLESLRYTLNATDAKLYRLESKEPTLHFHGFSTMLGPVESEPDDY